MKIMAAPWSTTWRTTSGNSQSSQISTPDGAQLVLHRRHPHALRTPRHTRWLGRRFLIDLRIAPDHVRGVAARFMIEGQVVGQHSDDLEPVAQLESDHRVALLAFLNELEIVFRRSDTVPAFCQIRHAAGEDHALATQMLAKPFAFVVQALPDAVAAEGRVDADIHAVEPVALRILSLIHISE